MDSRRLFGTTRFADSVFGLLWRHLGLSRPILICAVLALLASSCVHESSADSGSASDAESAEAARDIVDASDGADVAVDSTFDARMIDGAPDVGIDTMFDSTTCAAGQFRCSGVCVDLATDPTNCGVCGAACGACRRCFSGFCSEHGCPSDLCNCGAGSCVNLTSDQGNCGSCGNACAVGTTCVDAGCR